MASKFRLNQYNWFGQKLLVQHQYEEILKLGHFLDNQNGQISRVASEQMDYINCLALVKTSLRMEDAITTLQRLNFYKNNHYFLLLCRCLLYLGNYDSVVELCKQIINKEVDLTRDNSTLVIDDLDVEAEVAKLSDNDESQPTAWSLGSLAGESLEFKRLLASVSGNHLLNDPQLWFIFGIGLELQRQFRDAELAFKLATRLSSESGRCHSTAPSPSGSLPGAAADRRTQSDAVTCISNHYTPHIKYAMYSIRHKSSPKAALHILSEASSLFAQNHTLNPLLALVTCAQTQSSQANFARAFEIISNLETQFMSNRNPAITYNNLVLKLKRQVGRLADVAVTDINHETGDEHRFNLDYLLTRSHIAINSIVQESSRSSELYNINWDPRAPSKVARQSTILNQVDRLIELLRNSDSSCWSSAPLWNNLGVCYLLKRRLIACLSCFLRAQHLNPLDWRINYNISLAYLHVGLTSRAIISLMAAKNSFAHKIMRTVDTIKEINLQTKKADPLVMSLLAQCFDRLGQIDEARRFYVETTRPRKGSNSGAPVISLVNYLIYLHRCSSETDEETNKLKSRLLDQLEHSWLQRNQNDPQFNTQLMEIARRIGEETSKFQGHSSRKTYAWTKSMEPPRDRQNAL